MKKLFIAVFMFVSIFTSNVFADGHSIKIGIILTYAVFGEVPTILFILGGIIVITSVFFLHKIK